MEDWSGHHHISCFAVGLIISFEGHSFGMFALWGLPAKQWQWFGLNIGKCLPCKAKGNGKYTVRTKRLGKRESNIFQLPYQIILFPIQVKKERLCYFKSLAIYETVHRYETTRMVSRLDEFFVSGWIPITGSIELSSTAVIVAYWWNKEARRRRSNVEIHYVSPLEFRHGTAQSGILLPIYNTLVFFPTCLIIVRNFIPSALSCRVVKPT